MTNFNQVVWDKWKSLHWSTFNSWKCSNPISIIALLCSSYIYIKVCLFLMEGMFCFALSGLVIQLFALHAPKWLWSYITLLQFCGSFIICLCFNVLVCLKILNRSLLPFSGWSIGMITLEYLKRLRWLSKTLMS